MLYKDGRIAVVQSTLDTGLYQNPWVVSSFPCSQQLFSAPGAFTYTAGAIITPISVTTLVTIADITGSGYLDICALQAGAFAATLLLKITKDGVVVFNYTSTSSSSANRALIAVGDYMSATLGLTGGNPIYFRASLKIEAQQSASASAIAYTRYFLAAPYSA